MSRYIDADRLKKHFEWWEGEAKAKEFKEIFDEIIDAQPTAAVVEVVRCKECLLHGKCKFELGLGSEGFCSQGERGEENGEIH